jgi:hypothetical protein
MHLVSNGESLTFFREARVGPSEAAPTPARRSDARRFSVDHGVAGG